MESGQRKWTCRNCGRPNETAVLAGGTLKCEHCTEVFDATPEAPSTPHDDEARKRAVVARLRERYGEAREFVPWEPPLDAQSYGHLEWILGKQSSPEQDEAALGTQVSELVVLWLQDLARKLENQAFFPGPPGSDRGAASHAGVRQAAAEGLRTATRDFAQEFLSIHPGPVPEP
jgi:ribosomal protein L37AE/L43A